MKAFVLEKYGTPIRQLDLPDPVLGDDEVLVRLLAAGVNHGDERLRSGEFQQIFPFSLPMVVGSELAGEVVATGSRVTTFHPGMQVFAYPGQSRMGAFAEMIAIHQDHLAVSPKSVDAVAAASLPVAGLTAWQGLVEMGGLSEGQTVLIHGGSGGVGTVAIQLAKHLGARVATTVSAANIEFVRELGADVVIDYRTEDFTTRVDNVDLVLDTQGGATLKQSLDVLRPGGTAIGITGPPDPAFATRVGANPLVKFAISMMSSPVRRRARRRNVDYRFLFIRPHGEHLTKIADLVDRGIIRPVVDRVMPFERIPQALDALQSNSPRGKVVVKN